MFKLTRQTVQVIATTSLCLLGMSLGASAQGYPSQPVKVTVPFGAGGGTDTLVRTMSAYIEEVLGAELVVLNKPGAGSITGSRAALSEEPDGYNVLINHATLLTNMAVGKADFGLDAFTVSATTTAIPLVVVVPGSSEISSLDNLKEVLRGDHPVIAGVNIGAVNHFAMLMLEKELNSGKFRYVQTGGGAKTTAALLGDQISVGVLTGAEAKPLVEANEVKVIAALQDERIDFLNQTPTAKEQGADVALTVEHTWYFPTGTPREAVTKFAMALEEALANPELKSELENRGMSTVYFGGDVAAMRVGETLDRLVAVAADLNN